jgi:hypothetical protein
MERDVPRARFSIFSLIAVIAAGLSFATGAIGGLFFAVVAIVSGTIGVVLAFSSTLRGGMLSILSLLAGAIGVVGAGIKALMWLF